ncbi:ABC transporter ATP-binding protein [Leuconostoc palmae]|uniref:ABC transporter ATP-binding protein n=1 Tax=Leuconostoc palmae TaxID=501487 RepID=UPI001C7CEF49|nr:ABC transporter ATP-binding protein [Leuconostoc palmae]
MANFKIDQVTFAYNDHPILKNVTLQLKPGSFNLLVGPSGSGKSTLLKLLSGLYPTFSGGQLSGTLTLDGYSVDDIVPFQRVTHIGYLFQNPSRQFVMETPFEELQFTLENLQIDANEIPNRIEKAITQVGMQDFMFHDLMTLSGGEKQKIALAAVLAADSDYLLLDEPFANVDLAARLDLIQLIKKYQLKGKTVLIADHDWSGYADIIDDIFILSVGELHQANATERTHILSQSTITPKVVTSLPMQTESIIDLSSVQIKNGERLLLDSATLSFFKGKKTLITGPNGVGKSTLFNALVKLYPYSGKIFFQSQDIAKRKNKYHVRDVALVFQNAEQQFLAMTVEEELKQAQKTSLQPKLWSNEQLSSLLKRLDLAGLENHIVYQLSGGQQKKLQVLLMLMTNSPVLLFDEPLAGLDSLSQQNLLAVIDEVTRQQNQTIIVISHQLHVVTHWFDYHLSFDHQQLIYRGTKS